MGGRSHFIITSLVFTLAASFATAEEINQINLYPCGYSALAGDEVVTYPATEIHPNQDFQFYAVEGTDFGPNPFVVAGFMPTGLQDPVNQIFQLTSSKSFLIQDLQDVYGEDAFSAPFVGVMAVVPHPEQGQGTESIQCAIIYYTAGDPSSVSEYINAEGQYVGPHPATGGAGTWIGSGADTADTAGYETAADASIRVTIDSKSGATVQAAGGCGVIREMQGNQSSSWIFLIALFASIALIRNRRIY